MNQDVEIYSRQDMLGIYTLDEAIVVGLGGTGSWVAIMLAMTGTKTLHVFDMDTIEPSNLARLPFTEEDVGKKKTDVVKEFIHKIRPTCIVYDYDEATKDTIELAQGEVLFDCTDKMKVQMMLYEHTKTRGIGYRRCGYDGTSITSSNTASGWAIDGDEGGYTITPSWVVPSVIAAGYALVATQMANHSFTADIREFPRMITAERTKNDPKAEDKLKRAMAGLAKRPTPPRRQPQTGRLRATPTRTVAFERTEF